MEDLSMRVTQLELLVEHLYTTLGVEKAGAGRQRQPARARAGPAAATRSRAIKLYREETGCDLKSAHEVIDRLG